MRTRDFPIDRAPKKKPLAFKSHGVDGTLYDSVKEAEVARQLVALRHEHVVSGFLPHAKIAGHRVDFLVQLGPAAGLSSGEATDGRLVVVEYDGLGEERSRDLAPRILRMGPLADYGIELRWLLGNDYESVHRCLTDYQRPHFVERVRVCPACGHEESFLVIAKLEANQGARTVVHSRPCAACRKAARSDR